MLKVLKLTAFAVTFALASMSCQAEPVSDEDVATDPEPMATDTEPAGTDEDVATDTEQ